MEFAIVSYILSIQQSERADGFRALRLQSNPMVNRSCSDLGRALPLRKLPSRLFCAADILDWFAGKSGILAGGADRMVKQPECSTRALREMRFAIVLSVAKMAQRNSPLCCNPIESKDFFTTSTLSFCRARELAIL